MPEPGAITSGPERIVVIGMEGDRLVHSPTGRDALAQADLVVGGRRQLAATPEARRTAVLEGDLSAAMEAIDQERGTVCVLASGDPGFFGVVRPLAARFGPQRLEIHPGVSSVAMAFARLGVPWDDAIVVSAHGRPLEAVVEQVSRAGKAAVLVSPDNPPEGLGRALASLPGGHHPECRVHVCSRLGTSTESVTTTDIGGLAEGSWDPLSVVVVLDAPPVGGQASLAWGLGEDRFEHTDGMITKAEVRAVVLARLALPARGVLWDIGAGSGSVGIEAARLAPGLDVYAVERDPASATRVRRNANVHGVRIHVIESEAPGALDGLPDPDRIFVGGGGTEVLEAARGRLRRGGRVVATCAALGRADLAGRLLGHVVQLGVARGERLPDGGLRLIGHNPVFVAWGPEGLDDEARRMGS